MLSLVFTPCIIMNFTQSQNQARRQIKPYQSKWIFCLTWSERETCVCMKTWFLFIFYLCIDSLLLKIFQRGYIFRTTFTVFNWIEDYLKQFENVQRYLCKNEILWPEWTQRNLLLAMLYIFILGVFSFLKFLFQSFWEHSVIFSYEKIVCPFINQRVSLRFQ